MGETSLLLNKLKQYGNLSAEIESEITTKIKTIYKKKGASIVKEGQIISSFFVVEQGLIRSFYTKEDTEITIWFGYENTPFTPISSLVEGMPSRETIQCLEDCVFQYITGKDLNDLYQRYNEVNTIGRKLIEEYYQILDERNFAFQTQTAENRYKALLINEPEIINRVPLGYIASYLGIAQETLSRIRKK